MLGNSGLVTVICSCGWRNHVDRLIRCGKCGKLIEFEAGSINSTLPASLENPFWVKVITRYAKPEDAGIGDTVQRLVAKFGGEWLKWFAAKIGMPCGCTGRQAEWNARYPYRTARETKASDS